MRKYSKALVSSISENQKIKMDGQLEVIEKPLSIPAEYTYVDPFVKEIILKKAKSKKGFSLSHERNRKDKISYDLTSTAVTVEEELLDLEGYFINSYFFTPEKLGPDQPLIIFFHGGGYLAGGIDYYLNQCKLLAEQSESYVLFPEYRLAPENPFPAAIEDGEKLLTLILKKIINLPYFNKLVLSGDSAGAGIISGLLSMGKYNKKIDLVIEIYAGSDIFQLENQLYPWDLNKYPKVNQAEEFIYQRLYKFRDGTGLQKKYYLNGFTDYKSPLVSSNYWSDYRQLPELLLISAEFDYFRLSNEIFASKCLADGNKVTYIKYLGCDHGFLDHLGVIPQAEELILTIAKKIKETV